MSELCAQCGRALFGLAFSVKIGEKKYRVCSDECEKKLRAEKDNSDVRISTEQSISDR